MITMLITSDLDFMLNHLFVVVLSGFLLHWLGTRGKFNAVLMLLIGLPSSCELQRPLPS